MFKNNVWINQLYRSGRQQAIVLAAVWMAMQLLYLLSFGVVTSFEASKYIEQADNLLNTGSYSSGNYIYYSTEILLIALSKKLGAGYGFVVVFQLVCNAVSVYCFYKIIDRFTAQKKLAFLFTLLFTGMYYYHLYNVHLFTESLYFSFSILYFYRLLQVSKLSLRNVTTLLSGLLLLYFTRPVGLFFFPATFIFLVLKFFPKRTLLIFCTAGTAFAVLFFFLVNNALNSGGELDFLLPYRSEMIICGVSTISQPHQLSVPVEKDSVQGLLYIITHHWKLFFSLSLKRLVAFFGVVRPYFSLPHNLFIGFYFYGIYILLLAGIKKWTKQNAPEISFIGCLIFLTALTTALSCDEWHNRFIFTVLPFIMMLASLAFATPTNKVTSPLSK